MHPPGCRGRAQAKLPQTPVVRVTDWKDPLTLPDAARMVAALSRTGDVRSQDERLDDLPDFPLWVSDVMAALADRRDPADELVDTDSATIRPTRSRTFRLAHRSIAWLSCVTSTVLRAR